MKNTFLVTDKDGSDYRVVSNDITSAINKVVQEHELMVSDIASAVSTGAIGSVTL